MALIDGATPDHQLLKQYQSKRTLLEVPWIARLRVTTNSFGVNMTMEKAAPC